MDENKLPENQIQNNYRIGENMQCNIDAKGKAARLKLGILAMIGALCLTLITVAGVVEGTIWWLMAGGTAFGGAFAIFEARAGWCIVRAMGIKTPL